MDDATLPPPDPPRRVSALGPLSQPVYSISNILQSGIRRRQRSSRSWFLRKPDQEDPIPSTPIQIRAEVYEELVKRLDAAAHGSKKLNPQVLTFCLPIGRPNAELWRGLLDSPFLVSDIQLQQMLNLQKVNTASPRPLPGHVTFYIRSFCFEAGQLAVLLQDLFRQGDMGLESSTSWLEIVNNVESTTPIFIRYCGMSGACSAWERHVADMNSRTLRPLNRFLQATRLFYPEIIDQANIFEVRKAMVPYASDQAWDDLKERALVALLGPETLLNTASGGKHPDTSISQTTSDGLEILNTQTIDLLHIKTTRCPPRMEQEISEYVLACQKFANEHPLLTGTSSFPFTDALVAVNKHQATPAVTEDGEFTPLLTIGHDPTLTSFHGAVPFFDLDAFTTQQLKAAINTLGSLEAGQNVLNEGLAKILHAEGYLPFIDLFPWTRKRPEALSVVLKLTRDYLKATNPLIAVTWGGQVSSCALSNFKHEFGLRQAGLGPIVGIPSVQCYGDTSNDANDNAIIIIPSYHPNAVSYSGATPHLFVEIFHRTMAVAWLAVTIALSTPFTGNKREHCHRIIAQMQAKIGPDSNFSKAFQKCKNAWCTELRRVQGDRIGRPKGKSPKKPRQVKPPKVAKVRPAKVAKVRPPVIGPLSWYNQEAERGRYQTFDFDPENDGLRIQAESERWKAAREELVMVTTCQWAKHKKQSTERSRQAQEIWDLSIGALRTSITGQTQSAFLDWAKKVPENKSFYFEAATHLDMSRDIPNLLSLFHDHQSSENIEDGSWTENQSAVDRACQSLQSWVYKIVFDKSLTNEEAIEYARFQWVNLMNEKNPTLKVALRHLITTKLVNSPNEFRDKNDRIHGKEIYILPWKKTSSSATLTLHWADNQGVMQHLEDHGRHQKALLLPNEAMQMFEDDTRRIYFTPQGIDIRNTFGYSLSPKGSPVTSPLYDIMLQLDEHPVKEKLLELWERETGLNRNSAIFPLSQPQVLLDGFPYFYPEDAFERTEKRDNEPLQVGARGHHISEKHEIAKIKDYLPLQPGDMLWLIHKFLEHWFPRGGLVDASNPNFFPNCDTVWEQMSR